VKVWVSYRRWSDEKICETVMDERDLFTLKGDPLAVVRATRGDRGPDPRVVAARAFGQARKL
jgi:hypothetical protein